HIVINRGADEDNVVAQQARIDVIGALAARGLLHHHRDQAHEFFCSFTAAARLNAPSVALSSNQFIAFSWRILARILSSTPLSFNRARTTSGLCLNSTEARWISSS